jgi:hypothetical protein
VPGGNIALASGVPVTNSFNLSGFIGGFQGGCNWQAGAWVLGIEGDGSATNKSGQAGNAITSISTSAGSYRRILVTDGFRRQRFELAI